MNHSSKALNSHIKLYKVELKYGIRYAEKAISCPMDFQIGDFVQVEHPGYPRHHGVGIICEAMFHSYDSPELKQNLLWIRGEASTAQKNELLTTVRDEYRAGEIARELVAHRRLNLEVAKVEFAHDRKKLTLFYFSEIRVDFRFLLKDLYGVFKTRIWMQKLDYLHNPIHSAFPSSNPHSKASSDRFLEEMRMSKEASSAPYDAYYPQFSHPPVIKSQYYSTDFHYPTSSRIDFHSMDVPSIPSHIDVLPSYRPISPLELSDTISASSESINEGFEVVGGERSPDQSRLRWLDMNIN